MTPRDALLRRLAAILVEELGPAAAARLVQEEGGPDNGVRPLRRRRTIGDVEAARRAAALVPADDLARERARRRR